MTDRFAAFRHRSYALYFTSRVLFSFSSQVLAVAVAWQMYDETGDPALLGWIGLVQFLPALLLVVVTGITADKLGRRMVMGVSVAVEMFCTLAILALAVTGNFHPVLVLIILTLFGTGRAFYVPAAASLVVNLVPKEDFANAVSYNSSSWQLAGILGPVTGGLLYGLGAGVAYGTAAVLLAVSSALIFAIPKPAQKKATEETSISTLLGGFSYVWKQKIVLGAISLDLFAVLLGGAVALMPVYARDILDIGEAGLGLLRAAPGIGALIMVAIITSFPVRDHAGLIMFGCVGLFGLATVVFGFSTLAWVSVLALIFLGAFDMVSVYIREVLIQLWTPDQVRGRVNAVNSIFVGASNQLGEARAGFMAALYGAVFTVVAGGYAAIGIAAIWAAMFPQLRKARHLEDGYEEAKEKPAG